MKTNQALCSKAWCWSVQRLCLFQGWLSSGTAALLHPAWPFVPPLSMHISSKWPESLSSGSSRISPLTLTHLPSTSLYRSPIFHWAPVNHLSSLFFPLHLLVFLHPYVVFKSQTHQDSNFSCFSMCLVTSLCLLALLNHFAYK